MVGKEEAKGEEGGAVGRRVRTWRLLGRRWMRGKDVLLREEEFSWLFAV